MKYYERFEKSLLEEAERGKKAQKGIDFREICRAARVSPADMEEFFEEELGVSSIELIGIYEKGCSTKV